MSNVNSSKHNELQNNQNSFLKSIKVDQDEETIRLIKIKKMYDCGEISENEISTNDIKKIIELYKKEIQSIRKETKSIKNEVKHQLEQLKKSNS